MAIRKNTFLIKRSNIPGNVPTAGQILLGELALNTADVILYASGTTSNSILPIGWDRVSRTGDTMTGTLYAPSISATTISAITISATTYLGLPTDLYVTGGTYSAGTTTFTNNTGGTFSVSGFVSADTYITAFTYSNNAFTIIDNTGGTFSALFNTVTGLTVNGVLNVSGTTNLINLNVDSISANTGTINSLNTNIFSAITGNINTISANTISATTFYGDGSNLTGISTQDTYVTGFTYSSNTFVISDNTGGTFSSIINEVSGLTVNGNLSVTGTTNLSNLTATTFVTNILSATTISATTFFGDGSNLTGLVTQDTYVTGGTPDNANHLYTFTNNTGGTFNVTGLTDISITGGTYDSTTGIATFTNNTGGTFSLSGFFSTTCVGGSNLLGDAASFVILAGTVITNGLAGAALVSGDTGHISTLSAPFTYGFGSDYAGAGVLNGGLIPPLFTIGTPLGDAHAALLALTALTPTYSYPTGAVDLATDVTTPSGIGVFTPGVYYIDGAANIGAAGITLVGGGQYVFQINGALTSTAGSTIILSGGATSDMVYWLPVGATSLGATTSFVGNILSGPAAITTGAIVNIDGRLISESAITLGGGTPLIGVPSYTSGSTSGTCISVDTISATTYLNLPIDVYVTGGTPDNANHLYTFTNNTGGTFNVTGLTDISITGGTFDNSTDTLTFINTTGGTFTVSGLTDIYTTGFTFNVSNYDLSIFRNDGVTLTTNLGILSSDVTITGGSYNTNTGVVTFTNNTGGSFTVSGFITGLTDTTISSFTYNNANQFTITDSTGGTFTALINTVTGLTVNGNLSVTGTSTLNNIVSNSVITNTISATTYQNLPLDIFVTGGTSNDATHLYTFTNNTGGTFTVVGLTDISVTAGTYNASAGTVTFINTTGGTFSVNGLFTPSADTYVTGFTYVNNVLTIQRNQGQPDLSVLINTMTGLTINGNLSVTGTTNLSALTATTGNFNVLSAVTISATTYFGLPIDVYVTGGTFNNVTDIITFTNNTGGTFSVTGLIDNFTTGATLIGTTVYFDRNDSLSAYTLDLSSLDVNDTYVTGGTFTNNNLTLTRNDNVNIIVNINNFSGLTVNGDLSVTGTSTLNNIVATGITATTISATTYQNLPIDIRVTGGTPDNSNHLYTFTNNTGGTFTVIGLTDVSITGVTYSAGTTTFTNNTGGTFSVSGFVSADTFVTGFTYNNENVLTILRNQSLPPLSVVVNTMTGLTINGSLNVRVSGTSELLLFVDSTAGNEIQVGRTIIPDVNRSLSLGDGTHIWSSIWVQDLKIADTSGNDVINISAPILAGTPDPAWSLVLPSVSGATFSLLGVVSGASNTSSTGWFNISAGTNVSIISSATTSGGTLTISSVDTFTTGFTYNNNLLTINQNNGQPNLSVLVNTMTGLTINGNLSVTGTSTLNNIIATGITVTNLTATTISATTYLGLPIDVFVTGGTYSNGTAIFTNNTGSSFSINGFFTGATDVYVTGGTPNNTNHLYTFTNNTGGTFNVTGLTDVFVTGGTLSAGTLSFINSTGGTFNVIGFFPTSADTFVTGMTLVNGLITLERNFGFSSLTASTNVVREVSFGSSQMSTIGVSAATKSVLTPLMMGLCTFPGGNNVESAAGISMTVPNKYLGNPQFYFTWYASTTSANQGKITISLYTGSTAELAGGLTTIVETLVILDTPSTINTFLYSPIVTSALALGGGDSIHIKLSRIANDASDTWNGDISMINFIFRYTSVG